MGNDVIFGGAGNDDLIGSGFPNNFLEQVGDVLWGQSGDDLMNGGQGVDVLYGGYGDDLLIDGALKREFAVDTLFGGPGSDSLDVDNRPAAKDLVYCGSGVDRVDADTQDILFDCEIRTNVGT